MSIAADVIERMPVGPAHRKMFWLLGAGMLIDAFELFMQSGVLASMVNDGFIGNAGVAQFIFATFIGLAVGSVVSGRLADRFGRKFVYQFNLLLFSVTTLLTALAPSLLLVTALRFLAGIGLGGELVVGYAIMSEMTPAYCRGRWGVTLGLLVNSAQPISAFVGAYFLPLVGWRWMFVIGALPAFAVWFLRRSLPESPRWLERQGRTDEMHGVLDQLWFENTGVKHRPPASIIPPALEAELPWTALFSKGRLHRTIFCFVMIALIFSSQYGFISWVPSLLLHLGHGIVHSLVYSATMALGAPVGMLVPVLLIDRLGRRAIVCGATLCAGLVGMLYAFSLGAQPWVLVVTGFLEVFFLQIASNSIIAVYIPELFPTDVRGTGLGAATAVGRVAAGTMPYLVLAVLQAFGQVSVFAMLASILLALCLIVLIFGPETRRKTLEQVSPESNNTNVESTAAKSKLLDDHQNASGDIARG